MVVTKSLSAARVAVLGCGSVGGFAAWHLASAGVGELWLADREVLEADNVRRHLGSHRHVGQAKVDVVRDCLAERYPKTAFRAERMCFLEEPERLASVLAQVDGVLVAVDAEGPKYLIDSLTRDQNLPAIYVGVYGGGWGVEGIAVDPRRAMPCYACCARALGRVGMEVAAIETPAYRLPLANVAANAWPEANLLSISTAAVLGVQALLAMLESPVVPECAWRMRLRADASGAGEVFRRTVVPVTAWPDCPNCGEHMPRHDTAGSRDP